MSLKQSIEDNKQYILDSLQSEELKSEFLASLDKIEETSRPTIEEQVAEAQAPDHVSEDMYDGIKKELESTPAFVPMNADEEKAAIEEALKNVPTPSAESED